VIASRTDWSKRPSPRHRIELTAPKLPLLAAPPQSPQGQALAAAAVVLLIRYRVSWLILAGGAIGVLDHYLR